MHVQDGGGQALFPGSTCAANTMDVLSDICGCIVIDYMPYILYVDTTSDNIGTDKDVSMALTKSVQSLLSLLLRLLAVNEGHTLATSSQVVVQTIHIGNQVDEYDYGRLLVTLQDLHQFASTLIIMRYKLYLLLNRLLVTNLADLDKGGVLEVQAGHLFD